MSTLKKVIIGLAIFLAVVVLAAAIVIPMLLNVERYRLQVEARLQEQTGKRAEIGHLSLSLFPTLAIRVDDFNMKDPPGFPPENFLAVRRARAVLDGGALWDRKVVIKSLVVEGVVANLFCDPRGHWNFENPTHPRTRNVAAGAEKPLFTLGVISSVSVSAANLNVANLVPSAGTQDQKPFLAAHDVSGRLEQVDLNAFTGSADLYLSAPALRPPAWASFSSSIAYAAPLSTPAATGQLKADGVTFGTLSLTGVKTNLRLFPKQIYFDDLSFGLSGGHGTGALAMDLAGTNTRYSAHANVTGVDMAQLLAAFPGARGKMTGKMEGSVKVSGEATHSPDPLAGMNGTGRVSVRDGKLPSLQLNKNLMLLARLSNLGPASGDPSSFSSMSGDLVVANNNITSNNIKVIGDGVDVEMSGVMTLAGQGSLDFQGVAKITAAENALSTFLQNLSGATAQNGKLLFPFGILGTLANPKFLLKSLGSRNQMNAIQNLLNPSQPTTSQPGQIQPADAVQGIVDLFQKKKPDQAAPPPPPAK